MSAGHRRFVVGRLSVRTGHLASAKIPSAGASLRHHRCTPCRFAESFPYQVHPDAGDRASFKLRDAAAFARQARTLLPSESLPALPRLDAPEADMNIGRVQFHAQST